MQWPTNRQLDPSSSMVKTDGSALIINNTDAVSCPNFHINLMLKIEAKRASWLRVASK